MAICGATSLGFDAGGISRRREAVQSTTPTTHATFRDHGATTQVTIDVNGQPRQVEASIRLLSDRATIRVDGVPVSSTLIRRPFSSLFRYRFAIDATHWELRVSPDGLRRFRLEVVPATASVASTGISTGISTGAIAMGSGVPGALASLGLASAGMVPWAPSVMVGLGASLGTFAILWLVYGKRQRE